MVEREGAAQTPFLWRRIRTNHRARDESKRANTVRPLRRGLRQPRDGIHQENGRTQFVPYANAKENFHNPKNIPTTQRKFPACTVVHAGNPVIHRNPSITPFQGRVSGMGGRHPDKPPPHSHWATTGRKLPMQTRLTFPPVDKAETWSAHFRKLFLLRPRHSSTPNPPCNLSISIFRKHVMRRFIQWLRTCSFFGKQRMQTQAFRAPGRCGNRMRAYRLCHTRGNGNTGQNESATFPPAFGTQALPCGS